MKKLVLALVVVGIAFASQAAYLYWQIDTTKYNPDAEGKYYFNGHQIDTVVLHQVDSSGNNTIDLFDVATGARMGTIDDGTYAAALDDITGSDQSLYSYYIEFVGYDSAKFGEGKKGVIGTSQPNSSTYADLVANKSILPSGITAIPTMWTGGAVVAPEPTSGMLMMMGLALLSLKRRKV